VACYIETSALAKLIVAEPETPALQSWFSAEDRDPVSCDLARTELFRAVRRVAPDRVSRARDVLDSITLIALPSALFEHAARLEPSSLRTLDAIHLAAALDLGDDLDVLVTYDDRLAESATANGVRVLTPR
jgi:predicted nucleic acid-binding protein